ncbi:DUF6950 family protein [Alteriqipengyuania lutimaris]|uniref:DUF6950 domain-containing protein n=1 Tax=Alteriqipengyuania lutimaris TaxID=1538146 RepID=A0A395LH40_9SPHN|nr:hypothetical protein [Alteriqipengyuania lutimaris]MBB3035372.1 hypothetical protein [Alteriqipengyuania lutimaris]RDS75955.1 hypothetical protein DL238_14890 [Alteriqipengyuania lutimaris]
MRAITATERLAATERVRAQFARPFDWCGASCIHLAREQGIAMGHDLPPVPNFRTPRGAVRALRKMGAENTLDLLDRYFERWPSPAFTRLGDLVALPGASEHGVLDAIGIVDGRGSVFAWHAATQFEKLEPILLAGLHLKAGWKL